MQLYRLEEYTSAGGGGRPMVLILHGFTFIRIPCACRTLDIYKAIVYIDNNSKVDNKSTFRVRHPSALIVFFVIKHVMN